MGRRKVLRIESHVPSPTYIVPESYVALPAGVSPGVDMVMILSEMGATMCSEMDDYSITRSVDLRLLFGDHATAWDRLG